MVTGCSRPRRWRDSAAATARNHAPLSGYLVHNHFGFKSRSPIQTTRQNGFIYLSDQFHTYKLVFVLWNCRAYVDVGCH
jgi:hypothetical protein